MNDPQPQQNYRSIAWALLTQIVWLPLVVLDLHDRWQVRNIRHDLANDSPASSSDPKARNLASHSFDREASAGTSQKIAEPAQKPLSGFVLKGVKSSLDPVLNRPINRLRHLSSYPAASSPASTPSVSFASSTSNAPRPFATQAGVSPQQESAHRTQSAILTPSLPTSPTPLNSSLTGSDLLGGTLTLSDLDSPSMPPLARAENASWDRIGDPMAPLPVNWRDPVRDALNALPNAARHVARARVVHVPSTRVTESTTVPLAIQSDGSIDILSQPDSPEVVNEIASWSNRQGRPNQNTVVPALVYLSPLPDDPKPLSIDSQSTSRDNHNSLVPALEQRPNKLRVHSATLQVTHQPALESPAPVVTEPSALSSAELKAIEPSSSPPTATESMRDEELPQEGAR